MLTTLCAVLLLAAEPVAGTLTVQGQAPAVVWDSTAGVDFIAKAVGLIWGIRVRGAAEDALRVTLFNQVDAPVLRIGRLLQTEGATIRAGTMFVTNGPLCLVDYPYNRQSGSFILDPSRGSYHLITLVGDIHLVPLSGRPGSIMIVALTQDAAGGHRVTWTGPSFAADMPEPPMTPWSTDYYWLMYHPLMARWHCIQWRFGL